MQHQTFLAAENDELRMNPAESVMPPGVSKKFPDAKQLLTEDCIKPH